jgi:urease beta subunit
MKPGEIIPGEGQIRGNQGLESVTITVENTSDHAVQITSHYHFFEVNKRLRFDRASAYGRRLDVPSGSGVRWEPGEIKEVDLVEIAGNRRIFGFQGLVNGRLTEEQKGEALNRARQRGFLDREG